MQQPAAFFRFTNTSLRTCTLYGYPGFELIDISGKVIGLTVRRGPSYQINDPGPQRVTLAPGGSAYFGFGWVDVNEPNGDTIGCVMAGSAMAIPPNTTQQLRAAARLSSFVCPKSGGSVTAVALPNAFNISSP
jgi:Protein of unknown function (DUF4232)